jgi:hypothetical protein
VVFFFFFQNIDVDPEYVSLNLLPGESFLEPDVELRNIVSGSVNVQLWANGYLLGYENVRVSATYADRIAIIVLVALAGTALAFYIWKRVSKQEQQGTAHAAQDFDKQGNHNGTGIRSKNRSAAKYADTSQEL